MKPWHQHRAESMSDKASLVERLRAFHSRIMNEAAFEIETLRAQLAAAEKERDEYKQAASVEAGLRREFLARAEAAEARLAAAETKYEADTFRISEDYYSRAEATYAQLESAMKALEEIKHSCAGTAVTIADSALRSIKPAKNPKVPTPEALAEHRDVHLQVGRPTVMHPDWRRGMRDALWTIAVCAPWAILALIIWANLAGIATDCPSITAAGIAMCR